VNAADCIGCGLCALGCPSTEETGRESLSAKGRNLALQAGLTAAEAREPIEACTLCGYCDGVCPKGVRNVENVLELRRELAGSRPAPPSPKTAAVVLGCTIRERAPGLASSIRNFLERIGRPVEPLEGGCCGAPEVIRGAAPEPRVRAGVVCDPLCMERYDAEYLGELAMRRLELFDLGASTYYHVPPSLVNRAHARYYPLYDAMRRKTGCETNLDLNRLARSSGASASGNRDVKVLVERLLERVKAKRIVTCSPADYLAFRAHSGRETRFVTECLR
jgi:ferredoxin